MLAEPAFCRALGAALADLSTQKLKQHDLDMFANQVCRGGAYHRREMGQN
jgi:hypothetical protein